jgi:hypothetical protein
MHKCVQPPELQMYGNQILPLARQVEDAAYVHQRFEPKVISRVARNPAGPTFSSTPSPCGPTESEDALDGITAPAGAPSGHPLRARSESEPARVGRV